MLLFTPFKDLGPRFYRFFGMLAGAFTLIYGLLNYSLINSLWVGSIFILLLYILFMTYRPSPIGIKVLFPLTIAILFALFWEKSATFFQPLIPGPIDFALSQINFISSAFLLGATLNAMILGHWYLVEPKLAIDPFKTLTRAFISILVFRFLWIVGVMVYYWNVLPSATKWNLEQLLSVEGELVFLIQRLLFGILLPLMLCYFIWNTVKMRYTQSATGILYVTVVFILIGELIGIHLTLTTGFLM